MNDQVITLKIPYEDAREMNSPEDVYKYAKTKNADVRRLIDEEGYGFYAHSTVNNAMEHCKMIRLILTKLPVVEPTPVSEHGADKPEPPPNQNSLFPAVWDLVIEDMQKRDKMGTEKYGTRLHPFDGRDNLWDAYQEALDLAVYIRKAIYERDGK